jgi:hypothetical protein
VKFALPIIILLALAGYAYRGEIAAKAGVVVDQVTAKKAAGDTGQATGNALQRTIITH